MHSYLGKGGVNGNVRVYLSEDCFEIEEQLPVDIIRRRIYLDDVLMISHCRRFGWMYLLSTGLAAAFMGFIALILLVNELLWAGLGLSLITLAFGTMFLSRLVSRLDVITIHGRRKRAELTFGIKKDNVQPMFDKLVRAVQEKVAATNARIEREKPIPVMPEMPPPPEWATAPLPGTMPAEKKPPEWAAAQPPAMPVSPLKETFDEFRKAIDAPSAPGTPPTPPAAAPKRPDDELPPFMPPWRKPVEPERAPDSRDAWLPPPKTQPPEV